MSLLTIVIVHIDAFWVFLYKIAENSPEWQCSKWRNKDCIGKKTLLLLPNANLGKAWWGGFFFKENCVAQYGYLSQDMTVAVSNPREPESEEKPQKSLNEKQQVSSHLHTRLKLGSSCITIIYMIFHFDLESKRFMFNFYFTLCNLLYWYRRTRTC